MKIVFLGTPYYVLPILEDLHKSFKEKNGESPIVAVVTKESKPEGRKKQLKYSSVDIWAHKRGVPVYFNAKDLINNNIHADIGILASFGQIIPKEVISHFPNGILNIHPSLLPEYRGSSPVPATIVEGIKTTGVTIIKLDKEMDHGSIVSQFNENVKASDTTDSLRDRLFLLSSKILVELLPAFIDGKITPREQNHKIATFTRQITKNDAFIPPTYFKLALEGKSSKDSWKMPFVKDCSVIPSPVSMERFIRSMSSWPIAWTNATINNKPRRLKIMNASLKNEKLVPNTVQLEGKNPVTWKQFLEGYNTAIFE